MAKILQTTFVVLSLLTILYGFPQKPPDSNIIPAKENLRKKNSATQVKHQLRKVRDLYEETEDRPIGTFPADIDSKLDDTTSQDSDESNKQNKPLERSQISTLPATINVEADTSENENNTNESDEETSSDGSEVITLYGDLQSDDSDTEQYSTENDREARNAESDESGEEISRGNLRPPSTDVKIQPYRPKNRNSEESSESHEEDN